MNKLNYKIGLIFCHDENENEVNNQSYAYQGITKRLNIIYDNIFDKQNIFLYNLPPEFKSHHILRIINRISTDKPSKLIFIGPDLIPVEILSHLFLRLNSYTPQIYIHLFDNFMVYHQQWAELEHLLMKKLNSEYPNLLFICSSLNQTNFIKQFLNNENCVTHCPFPLLDFKYHYNPEAGDEFRKKNKIAKNMYLFLVHNNLNLTSNFISICKKILKIISDDSIFDPSSILPDFRILLAGNFQDTRIPFIGTSDLLGHSHGLFKNFLESLPEENRKYFIFIPYIKECDLMGLYNASDILINLDINHYGELRQNVIWANACSLPCVVSTWGDYYHGLDQYYGINTNYTSKGLIFNFFQLSFYIFNELQKGLIPVSSKQKFSKTCHHYFSIENLQTKFKEIMEKPCPQFSGFNWRLAQFHEDISDSVENFEESFYCEIFSKNISRLHLPKR